MKSEMPDMYTTIEILFNIKRKMIYYENFSILCNRYQIYSKANRESD